MLCVPVWLGVGVCHPLVRWAKALVAAVQLTDKEGHLWQHLFTLRRFHQIAMIVATSLVVAACLPTAHASDVITVDYDGCV